MKTENVLFLWMFLFLAGTAFGDEQKWDPFLPDTFYGTVVKYRTGSDVVEQILSYDDFDEGIVDYKDAGPGTDYYLVHRFQDGLYLGTDRVYVDENESRHYRDIEIVRQAVDDEVVTVKSSGGQFTHVYQKAGNIITAAENDGRVNGAGGIGAVIVMEEGKYTYYDSHDDYRQGWPERIVYFTEKTVQMEQYAARPFTGTPSLVKYYEDGLLMRQDRFFNNGETYTETWPVREGTGEITSRDSEGNVDFQRRYERRLDEDGFWNYEREINPDGSGIERFIVDKAKAKEIAGYMPGRNAHFGPKNGNRLPEDPFLLYSLEGRPTIRLDKSETMWESWTYYSSRGKGIADFDEDKPESFSQRLYLFENKQFCGIDEVSIKENNFWRDMDYAVSILEDGSIELKQKLRNKPALRQYVYTWDGKTLDAGLEPGGRSEVLNQVQTPLMKLTSGEYTYYREAHANGVPSRKISFDGNTTIMESAGCRLYYRNGLLMKREDFYPENKMMTTIYPVDLWSKEVTIIDEKNVVRKRGRLSREFDSRGYLWHESVRYDDGSGYDYHLGADPLGFLFLEKPDYPTDTGSEPLEDDTPTEAVPPGTTKNIPPPPGWILAGGVLLLVIAGGGITACILKRKKR